VEEMTAEIELKTLDRAREQLHAMLALVERGQVRCSATTKRPTAATMRLLAESLPGGDSYPGEHFSAFSWPLLLQAGGACGRGQAGTDCPGSGGAQEGSGRGSAGVVGPLWVRGGVIDELSRLEAIKGQKRTNTLSSLKIRRSNAADVLAVLDPSAFTMIEPAFNALFPFGSGFSSVRGERATYKLYIAEPRYASLGYSHIEFARTVDMRYLMVLLFEYAATLGLVEVRYVDPELAMDDVEDLWGAHGFSRLSRYDGLRAVRLTELGVRVAGSSAQS
jgi:hypothetical protein